MKAHRLTELPGGLRVVTEAMPAVRSVALGFWIGTGSRAESDGEAGLSHLLEHLLFRGSARYSSIEIDQTFDAMGAELNAGTGKETTSIYSRVIDGHMARALDVMSDMTWRPALEDVDAEREVVLEEIAMYEDDPQDKVFDVLGGAIFGDHPLGRAIMGRAEVIAGTSLESIRRFHSARYVPANVVIAAAGSVEHDELVELVVQAAPSAGASVALDGSGLPRVAPGVRFERKDTEQVHVCVGGPGLARDDERRFALRVLDNIFGGTSSSRLFQEIRERRGLAYAVQSFASHYAGVGQVGLYLGTRPDNLVEAMSVVGGELERLVTEPVSDAELERSKENVKGRLVLSLEFTTTRMNRLGSSLLTGVPLLSVDELIERIDAVTVDDLAELAGALYASESLSAAGIGPDEDAFRAALEPVSAELTSAGGAAA